MIRKMGNTEKGMARIAMDKGNFRIASIIKLKHPKEILSMAILRSVMGKLQKRHPVLNLAICVQGDKKQKFYWEQNNSIEIPITEYNNNESPIHVWKEQASRPLKNGDGVCSLAFISGTAHSTLIIFLEHLAGDAASYTNLCHEILSAISEKDQPIEQQRVLDFTSSIEQSVRETLGGKLKSSLACLADSVYFFTQLSKKHRPFPIHPVYKTVKVSELTKSVEQTVLSTEFTEQQSLQILRFCRKNKTTVTGLAGSVLSDAFARVYRNHFPGTGQISVLNNCAVSTRQLYAEPLSDENLGCHYSFAAPITVTSSGKGNLPEMISNAKGYQQNLSQSVASKYPLGFSLFTGLVRSRASDNYPAKRDANLFLTNWGTLKLNQQYGEWEISEVQPLITLTRMPALSIILSSFASRLRLTISAASPFIREHDLMDVHKYAIRLIKEVLNEKPELQPQA